MYWEIKVGEIFCWLSPNIPDFGNTIAQVITLFFIKKKIQVEIFGHIYTSKIQMKKRQNFIRVFKKTYCYACDELRTMEVILAKKKTMKVMAYEECESD